MDCKDSKFDIDLMLRQIQNVNDMKIDARILDKLQQSKESKNRSIKDMAEDYLECKE